MNNKTVFSWWVAGSLLLASGLVGAQGAFSIEESTIDSTHKAIQEGRITCKGVVQAYLDRVKAYNGTCTALVTADGKPIKTAKGIVRARQAAGLSDENRCRVDVSAQTSTSTRDCRSSSGAWSRRSRIRACSSSSACASAFRTRARSTRSRH